MGAPAGLEKGPAAHDSGAPAYPPMVQGYPQRGSCVQQPGDFATEPPPRGDPRYAPGCGVPDNSAQAVHSSGSCGECCGDFLIRVIHKSEIFNIQWVLFVFGCFFVVPSIVAVFLGLIQHGRLQKEPSYRSSWLCNIVLSVLWILAAVLIAVLATRAQRAEQLSNSYNHG